jgi:hypothetical protein
MVIFIHDFTNYRSQNLELARYELRNSRDEHLKLIQLRERLLGRMAEGVM